MSNLFLMLFFSMLFYPFSSLISAPSGLEINYTVGSANQFTFSHYLENLHRLSRIMMRQSATKQIQLQIIVVADFPEGFKINAQNKDLIIADLTSDGQRLQYDSELNRKLIETFLLTRAGIQPNELKTPFPDWIITGLFTRINPRYQGHVIPATRFPGLSALVTAKALPDVVTVLTTPIIAERDGTAARMLYEEFCLFALDCVELLIPSSKKVFFETAKICNESEISDIALFQQTIITELIRRHPSVSGSTDREKIQEIFNYYAAKRFLTSLDPPSVAEQEKCFNNIVNFSYKINSGSGVNKRTELRSANLEQLPMLYRDIADAPNTVTLLNTELSTLANQANSAVRASITELININREIIIGGRASPRTHSQKIRLVISEFRNIIDFHKRVEARLIELENENISPADYFKLEISEIKSFSSPFPEIENLLDKHEADLKSFRN